VPDQGHHRTQGRSIEAEGIMGGLNPGRDHLGWWRRTALARALVLAVSTLALLAGAPVLAGAVTPASQAPYTDPNAVGYLGLCNQAGQQITSGTISTTPLAWRIVSSVPAQPPYDGSTRTAIVLAYQPRQGLPPGEWSGEAITASSRYSSPAAPMAAATDQDYSLANFLSDFPASWNGFVQLRMYLGAANQEQYSLHYPVLDLQVIGSTWHAAGGGSINCSSGTAESLESIVLPSTTTTSPSTQSTKAGSGAGAAATTTTHATTTSSGARSSSGSGAGVAIAIAAIVLAAAAGGVALWRRRRRSGSPPDS
jgi:hypothetical protein